jgi:hypothetical protein
MICTNVRSVFFTHRFSPSLDKRAKCPPHRSRSLIATSFLASISRKRSTASLGPRRTDAQNVAIRRVLRFRDPRQEDALAAYRFTCKDCMKSRAERILAEHTNNERVALGGCRSNWPFDKSGKVVEVGSLYFILTGSRLLGGQGLGAKQRPHYDQSCAPRQKASSAPVHLSGIGRDLHR